MMPCFLYRRKLSAHVDANLDLAPTLQRHLGRCAGCRRFYEQDLSIARSLARSADKERVAPSPFLQPRIMAAIERSGRTASAHRPVRRLAWAIGAAAVLMLAVWATYDARLPRQGLTKPELAAAIQELAALETKLPNDQTLRTWSGTLDKPLDTEMVSILHDARSAAQALVNNLLPDSLQ
jgi:hypothetical protein